MKMLKTMIALLSFILKISKQICDSCNNKLPPFYVAPFLRLILTIMCQKHGSTLSLWPIDWGSGKTESYSHVRFSWSLHIYSAEEWTQVPWLGLESDLSHKFDYCKLDFKIKILATWLGLKQQWLIFEYFGLKILSPKSKDEKSRLFKKCDMNKWISFHLLNQLMLKEYFTTKWLFVYQIFLLGNFEFMKKTFFSHDSSEWRIQKRRTLLINWSHQGPHLTTANLNQTIC